MTRYIIFGDTHACPPSLEQILTSGVKMDADVFISLGDVFGYGPSPISDDDPDEKKKGCLELLEGRFYEKRVAKDGRVSYILILNRHLLLGNHDRMVLTGEIPPYIDGNAKAGVKLVWEQIGVDRPVVPGEARKELEGIHRYTKRPTTERSWLKQKTYGWVVDLWNRSKGVIPPEERIEIEENTSSEEAEKIEKYRRLKKQEVKFKPYHDLLKLWKPELVLEDEKLMFAHAFPPSLAEHADKLGIEKSAIDLLEVYVVSRDEWGAYAADNFGLDEDALRVLDAYVKGESQSLDLGLSSEKTERLVGERKRRAIAEEVVELIPEGFVLFIGHYHKELIIKGKDGRQLFRPGPGFNPRAKPGEDGYDYANFVSFDNGDLTTIENGFYRVKYDRAEVDQEMEAAKNAR